MMNYAPMFDLANAATIGAPALAYWAALALAIVIVTVNTKTIVKAKR